MFAMPSLIPEEGSLASLANLCFQIAESSGCHLHKRRRGQDVSVGALMNEDN
jgi:hypothetical protein